MDLAAALVNAFHRALDAVEPRPAVAEAVRRLGLPSGTAVTVLAVGKAAAGMAWGVRDGQDGPLSGVVVTPAEAAIPAGLDLVVGDHPLPGEGSLAAGRALLQAATAVGEHDVAIALVSGGGSALAEVPVLGVGLGDLRTTTEVLLRSGAPIEAMNAVRTRLSRLKGGGLAGAVRGTLHTLVISDVVGDRLDVIASGPTVATTYGPEEAAAVVGRYDPAGQVPATVRAALAAPPDTVCRTTDTVRLVAGRQDAALAAAAALRTMGLDAAVVEPDLDGEAREVMRRVIGAARPGRVDVYAGETTVTVVGGGVGGRNHEAALAAAIVIEGTAAVVLAAGTDGIDGMTDGAGAVVDGGTAAAARDLGIDPEAVLADNDAGGFFDRVPGRISTGPTGTNVGDVWLVAGG